MPPQQKLPMLVALDIGHYCTKVGVNAPHFGATNSTQYINWMLDGGLSYTIRTMVSYPASGENPIAGLPSEVTQESETFGYFKLQALKSTKPDQESWVTSESGKSSKLASQVFEDFLHALAPVIKNPLMSMIPGEQRSFDDMEVELLLTVPIVVGRSGAQLLSRIGQKVFERPGARHKVLDIRLTEAEAAAAGALASLGQDTKSGTTILVIDAGGGTTDLAMATVAKDLTLRLDTTFVQPVSSPQFGGVHIDHAFEQKLKQYLQMIKDQGHDQLDLKAIASGLMLSRTYMKGKHRMKDIEFKIGLPSENLPEVHENGGIDMKDGTLFIKKEVMEELVDAQIRGPSGSNGISSLATTLRDDLFVRNPSRSRSYRKSLGLSKAATTSGPDKLNIVFFCGGLGGNDRLQKQVELDMKAGLPRDDIQRHVTTDETIFLTPAKGQPQGSQLCVCSGLLLSRRQELATGKPIFTLGGWLSSIFSKGT